MVSGADGEQVKMEYSVDDIDKPLELVVQVRLRTHMYI